MPFVKIAKWFRDSGKTGSKSRTPLLNFVALEDRAVPAASLVDRNFTLFGSGDGPATVLGNSRDGRYAIFTSKASDLISGQADIPGTEDLFWSDLLTGEVRIVTNLPTLDTTAGVTSYTYDRKRSFSTALPFGPTFAQAVISDDGLFVAFTTKLGAGQIDARYITKSISPNSTDVTRTIDPDRGNTTFDAFRWEAKTGAIQLASRTFENSAQTNEAFGRRADAINPAISSDGSVVTFLSNRSAETVLPLRPIQTPAIIDQRSRLAVFDNGDASPDLFLTDMSGVDTPGGGSFKTTVLSKIGTGFVSYDTVATTTVIIGGTSFTRPIQIDVQTYTTVGGLSPNGAVTVDTTGRYLGGDGFTAVYTSDLDPSLFNARPFRGVLTPVDPSIQFTYQSSKTATRRQEAYWTRIGASSSPQNATRLVTSAVNKNSAGDFRSIGANGGFAQNAIIAKDDPATVVITASIGTTDSDSQIVAGFLGDANRQEIYSRRMTGEIGGTATLVTAINKTTSGAGNGALPINNALLNTVDPQSYQVTPGGDSVVFTSASSNLVPTTKDINAGTDVFLKDVITGSLQIISVRANGTQTGSKAATRPAVSSDSGFVGFESIGTDYVNQANTPVSDTNGVTDIFVRDLGAKSTGVASTIENGATTGNGPSFGSFIGTNGITGRIVFTSSATNLDSLFPITPGNTDVYTSNIPLQGQGNTPTTDAQRKGAVAGGRLASAAFVEFSGAGITAVGDRFSPFPGFTGELRVATADITGDGVLDMVIGSGPGGGPRVVVIDGASGKTVRNFFAFEASFQGGVNVAAADFNGDGFADIVIGADDGGGARVKIVDGSTGVTFADFFAYEPSFRGGVRVGVGDVGQFTTNPVTGDAIIIPTADGVPDLITGAGIGGGPRVSVFDGVSLTKNRGDRITDFFAFENSLRNGVYVAGGDFNGDLLNDIVVGAGPGGGPRVQVFEAKSLINTPDAPTSLINFFGFSSTSRQGVRVAVKNVDGDAVPDLLIGEGAGNISRIRTYAGGKLDALKSPNLIDDTVLFDDFSSLNGAQVG